MKKSVRIITGALGFMMVLPGLAKFTEPFKTFIYQHLEIIGFPFPSAMQYVVKFSELAVGFALIFLAIKGNTIDQKFRRVLFTSANLIVVVMMIVAIYTHLHPDIPAEILPMEYKPPLMGISYIILVVINFYLDRRNA
ncbi:hypothetical protein [Reichenbachiella versicolor]|uniref:hypothetical protein n=1 Tax=Reichenbachiella versicolor TaxID=1821036 RepID=UPI000D6E2B5A|nr:hypothetical protein [Reichenbachiella versicolor]